jgi:hypothetical protein
MKKLEEYIKSYWHAAIAIETTFASGYVIKLAQGSAKFDWYTFAYAAVGALVAPATRALVKKWPLLSPLAYRIATKFKLAQVAVAPKAPAYQPPITTVKEN